MTDRMIVRMIEGRRIKLVWERLFGGLCMFNLCDNCGCLWFYVIRMSKILVWFMFIFRDLNIEIRI